MCWISSVSFALSPKKYIAHTLYFLSHFSYMFSVSSGIVDGDWLIIWILSWTSLPPSHALWKQISTQCVMGVVDGGSRNFQLISSYNTTVRHCNDKDPLRFVGPMNLKLLRVRNGKATLCLHNWFQSLIEIPGSN